MILIALTGGIGSGKTYVASLFKKLGVPVIYADQVARELIFSDKHIYNQIKQYFNTLDLKKIKTQIFKNKKKDYF